MIPASLTIRPDRLPEVAAGCIEHLVEDMTVIAAADLTLAALQARLAEAGQWLPVDGEPAATLGDLIAGNSTGPLRLGYGGWRDLLLGVQFFNPRGELISAGGRTVKNVAGYDLTKLMVGQGNALGRIATFAARTYRLPAAALLVERALPAEPLSGEVNRLLASPLRPTWMLVAEQRLLCGYLGDAATIAFHEQELSRQPAAQMTRHDLAADSAVRRRHWRWPGAAPTARISVPPAQVADLLERHPAAVADPVHGIVLIPDADRSTVEALDRQGLYWDGSSFTGLNPRPVEAAMIEKLKAAFAH